ncbi:hypothetical protein DSO57_1016878 [Entomophthora muscae]|uniref:Uncharacterized protein n=1 Tax=Entomophthora muscae TaxID=34485 RepID=A0ACC2TRP9_9FUNG|nr:hypothetical protein DSO57_1016878 [Entomophthora muscae]
MDMIFSIILSLLVGSSAGFKPSEIFKQTVYEGSDIVTVDPVYWTLKPRKFPDCYSRKCLLDPGVVIDKRAFVRMELFNGHLLPRTPGCHTLSKVFLEPRKGKQAYAGINIFITEHTKSLSSFLTGSRLDKEKVILSVGIDELGLILSVAPKVVSEKVGSLHVRFPADSAILTTDSNSIRNNIEKIKRLGYNVTWIVPNQAPKSFFDQLVAPDKLHFETVLPKTVNFRLFKYGEFDDQATA